METLIYLQLNFWKREYAKLSIISISTAEVPELVQENFSEIKINRSDSLEREPFVLSSMNSFGPNSGNAGFLFRTTFKSKNRCHDTEYSHHFLEYQISNSLYS